MKAVIQRVGNASVSVAGKKIAEIGQGLLILLGVSENDTQDDILWLSKKIANTRIFNDANGQMNKSLLDMDGDAIVVSQFTLQASVKKGNRPSYLKAAKPAVAKPLYIDFIKQLETDLSKKVQAGEFGADMKVSLLNDGPVTLLFDTENKI
ncbi:D-aminoacyl-tRNA deacylase [Polaribacter pacificus]|uniref:D-aminoacyl-tRNA deacylase n=1 Tax=Polaribacter pacificus TaxID=1775173 RepID=A0A917MDM0_9FLAO|nr:D-aminoacyl-tRNA deacylase [Polaribacter pacificus]GGG95929.1 D-aminoacyl-tRNA deacylase [Polaribacter pacificus]